MVDPHFLHISKAELKHLVIVQKSRMEKALKGKRGDLPHIRLKGATV